MKEKQLYFLICGVLLFLICLSFAYDGERLEAIFSREGGFVEVTTTIIYFICIMFMLIKGKANYIRPYHYFPLLMLMFLLRELDFDKRFTEVGIFKSRFFGSELVSTNEKIAGAMVIMLLLYLVFMIFKNHFKSFIQGLKQGAWLSISVASGIVLMVVSKIMDGLERRMLSIDIQISSYTSTVATVVEEVLELGIPMMFLLATFIFLKEQKSTT